MPEAPKPLLTLHEALLATLPYLELLAEAFTNAAEELRQLLADEQARPARPEPVLPDPARRR
jgi:hypothetical protein